MNCGKCNDPNAKHGVPCVKCGAITMAMGELAAPETEVLSIPWTFRAACYLKDPSVIGGALVFGLILDLGFEIYRQIDCVLDGVAIVEGRERLVVDFASNWAANGDPNKLSATTITRRGRRWLVDLHRAELHLETLKVDGMSSLAHALVEQGIAMAWEPEA